MIVIVTEKAPPRLRGELTRWLLETKTGVFVGKVSAMVREKLWEKVCEEEPAVSAVLIYSTSNEQGFSMKMHGEPQRQVVELEGIQLIKYMDEV